MLFQKILKVSKKATELIYMTIIVALLLTSIVNVSSYELRFRSLALSHGSSMRRLVETYSTDTYNAIVYILVSLVLITLMFTMHWYSVDLNSIASHRRKLLEFSAIVMPCPILLLICLIHVLLSFRYAPTMQVLIDHQSANPELSYIVTYLDIFRWLGRSILKLAIAMSIPTSLAVVAININSIKAKIVPLIIALISASFIPILYNQTIGIVKYTGPILIGPSPSGFAQIPPTFVTSVEPFILWFIRIALLLVIFIELISSIRKERIYTLIMQVLRRLKH